MSLSNQLKNQHLMWRAGFGPAAVQLDDLAKISPKQLYRVLKKESSKNPEYIDVADDVLKGMVMGMQEIGRMQKADLSPEKKKEIQQRNRESIRSLNLFWLHEMVNSNAQLREKMAFFWHGHFACRNLNVFFQQGLLDVIRQNALGNFRDMLHEVSKTAAMLNFLNNNQNRKDHPNENFAREVMELFTLGRCNYTEHDVKEAARAFTGWGANFKGEFVFRKFQHDAGSKTVLGKTGNFDGDEVLDILLEQKQAAKFITQKIYRFFVNETPDAEKVNWLAERFYKSNYDISALMDDIFTSDWFYDDKNIGCKIKSPIELLAGIQRILPMKLENDEALVILQRILGQMLFYPPNVAGWPGGKTWIDSSTLMMRMRIPNLINDTDELNVKPKDDDDQMMGRKDNEQLFAKKNKPMIPRKQQINAELDWKDYLKYYESIPREELIRNISQALLQVKPQVPDAVISQYADASGRENFIKTATIQVMATPEYQLC
ncbi:MAG: DUF1800 domain-containing protein [Bacteroidetes bacterium]|nr:DUF1800 domain-containing protein [Bacteroidota bacterium]